MSLILLIHSLMSLKLTFNDSIVEMTYFSTPSTRVRLYLGQMSDINLILRLFSLITNLIVYSFFKIGMTLVSSSLNLIITSVILSLNNYSYSLSISSPNLYSIYWLSSTESFGEKITDKILNDVDWKSLMLHINKTWYLWTIWRILYCYLPYTELFLLIYSSVIPIILLKTLFILNELKSQACF